MAMSAVLYNICTIGYVFSLFAYIANLALRRRVVRQGATVLVALSFLLQTIGMLFRWIEAGEVEVAAAERASGMALSGAQWWVIYTQHPPWSNLYEIMVYMSWGIVLVYLVTEVKFHVRFVGVIALMLALSALGMASLTDGMIKPLVPALKSWWIMVHVISASIAYAAGTIGAIVSLLYLVKAKERISLTSVAMGTMGLSAFLLVLLGRFFVLFREGAYKVKLIREMGDEEIVVGQFVGDKWSAFYASSPGVGILMIMAIISCLMAAVWLWKHRKQDYVPTGVGKWLYVIGFICTLAALCVALYHDLSGYQVSLDPETASKLMPPGPWRLSLRSHAWDIGLWGVILLGQVGVGMCCLWPKKIQKALPSADKLDTVAYNSILVAFALVAVVLVTGALWAHYAWGRYWAWDPKETGALIIWLTYALYLHTRVTYGWAGVRTAIIGVFGFFVILAGFLGVNLGFFAEGLHSYGSS